MGVGTEKSYLWLTVSCGSLVRYIDKVKTPIGNFYEGTILDIREKEDEYEGKKVVKIQVKMKDSASDEEVIISFTKKAIFALGFFARITEIDITKPFKLGVAGSKDNEKISFCRISQGTTQKVEANKDFPKPEKVEVSGEKIDDYTKPFEAMAKIMTDLMVKLTPATPTTSEAAPTTATETGEIVPSNVKKEDDLPF